MSRSDFWSIAATLIVTGVAYFVGGQKSAYGCIALGGVIALYLLFTRKKSEPAMANQLQIGQGGPQQQGQGAAQQQQQAFQQVTGDVVTINNYGPVTYHTSTKGETDAGTD